MKIYRNGKEEVYQVQLATFREVNDEFIDVMLTMFSDFLETSDEPDLKVGEVYRFVMGIPEVTAKVTAKLEADGVMDFMAVFGDFHFDYY